MLLFSPDGTVSTKTTNPSTNQVLYTTTHISRSQFSYSFFVIEGPKFIRLFFYPASYPSFSKTNASFTIQSSQFFLLHDFKASLNA